MTDPVQLKRQRAGHRAVATRRIKEVEDTFTATPEPEVLRLDQLKFGLQSTLDALKDVDKELMPHLDPADIVTEIEQSERVRDEIFGAIVKLERSLAKRPMTHPSTPTRAAVAPVVTAKLPKLILKSYSGSLTGWSAFWDAFKTAVHDNPGLGNVDKFAYLMSLLEGTAKESVAGLALTDVNYTEAIAILERRFGDKERIKACHIEQLMGLESVSSEHNLLELRRLYDRTESNIRGLKTIGVGADAYGALFIPIFMKKLPSELKLSLTRKVSATDWNIDEILEVLREELEARERALGTDTKNRNKSSSNAKRGKDYPTTGAYTSSGEVGCCYCKLEGHSPSNCRKVTDIDERKKLIREGGRCFNCLRKGHIGRDCHSSSRCSRCKGRHHTSICLRANKPQFTNRDSLDSSNSKQRGLNPEAPPFKQPEPTTSCYTSASDTILLQTAKAFAFNLREPSRKIIAYILFDSGSQCSYISERACRRLGLDPLGTRSVSILTFGSKKESRTDCKIVRVGLGTEEDRLIELKLLSIQHICEPIANAAVDLSRYPQLKNLDFTIDYGRSSQIKPDILIGSDQYWKLMTGEIVKHEQGPIALNTRLGWILSGPVSEREGALPHTTLVTHVLRVDGINENKSLDKELHSFWNMESIGIIESENIVQNQFEENVSFVNGRYVVSLHWKPFVLNRVKEIRVKVPDYCWHHCQGGSNPADKPSRGLTMKELQECGEWFTGPSWLSESISRENEFSDVSIMPSECLKELRVKDREAVTLSVVESTGVSIGSIMDIEHFSSYEKLIGSTAYVISFISKLKQLIGNQEDSRGGDREEDLRRAEVLWLRDAQDNRIRKEWKNQFVLYLDEDKIWRCRGRLGNSDLPYNTKHPIILPKDHPLTRLAVQRAHHCVVHSGIKDTLTELRSRFWIPQGRAVVRSFIHQCVICRRYAAANYKAPPAPLPDFRVQQDYPFASVGVDYAGPLMIRYHAVRTQTSLAHTSRGKQNAFTLCNGKAWVCLFTCCVTRAVHLDVVTDLSSQSFLRCLKRFIARRGLPSRIVSDNGTTFKGASKSIRNIMDHPEVRHFMSGVNVKWDFNIERAPWWGGFFERMVQLLKRCLRKLVGRAKLTYEELLTGVTEVELILNSRPLTYISATDLDEPITPSHLLTGRRLLDLPDYLCQKKGDEDYNCTYSISQRMNHLNNILDHFWNRWRREYLTELRENHRRKNPDVSNIAKGDVVIIHDDTHRGLWRLGVVEKTLKGKDGIIRGAVVRIKEGSKVSSFLRRPIQRLYPLEVRSQEVSIADSVSNSMEESAIGSGGGVIQDSTDGIPTSFSAEEGAVNSHPVDVSAASSPLSSASVPGRPSRRAALEARDRIIARLMD